MKQSLLEMNLLKEQIKLDMKAQMGHFIENLQMDQETLRLCDNQTRQLMPLLDRVDLIDQSVNKIKANEIEMLCCRQFIESSLPMYVHMQLCEGLNVIAG